MKTRKKWLRKTTAICTAALLGTAAIPSTAFAADSYASIEKDAWAKKVTEMASSYATSIEESQSLMSGMQSDMILKFEDSGRSLLGFVAPFDVSWLDNVTLSNDISFTEGKEGILMTKDPGYQSDLSDGKCRAKFEDGCCRDLYEGSR